MSRTIGFALITFGMVAWLWGCGGTAGIPTRPTDGPVKPPPPDTQPPSIAGRLIGPNQISGQFLEISFTGGQIQVEGTVNDPSGVDFVELTITPSPPNFQPQRLSPDATNQVRATVTLPTNTGLSNQTYQFRLRARDKKGNEGAVDVGVVVVLSPLSGVPPIPRPTL